jgi:NAD(P)-dependent dehydrogenase (short-subunit alcohol dehydrogenase family)
MDDGTRKPLTRRAVLTAAGAGTAAGFVAGLAGGVQLASPAYPKGSTARLDRKRFEGKVIAITGATSGIGRAAAEAFAAEGGKVAFCGRRETLGREVQDRIRAAGGTATYIKADVLVEAEVKAFIDRVAATYGGPNVAFNNAGITIEKPLHEYSTEEWDRVNHTNVRGVYFAMKYEIPYMLRGGGGNILVTSSSNAIATTAHRAAYAASKRALVGLVQAAALDYGLEGIRVNAILPGTTDTALVRSVAGMQSVPDALWEIGARQWAKSNVPGLERMATPEEIAAFALTLASDDYPFMTGAQMVIDGGKTASGG